MDTLNKYNPFFDSYVQRDALEAFTLLLEAFNIVCRKPKAGYEFPDIPEYMSYYFWGVFFGENIHLYFLSYRLLLS